MFKETKKWYESETIRGVLVNIFCKLYLAIRILFKLSGINLPIIEDAFFQTLVDVIIAIASFLGDYMAIKGRINATTKIE